MTARRPYVSRRTTRSTQVAGALAFVLFALTSRAAVAQSVSPADGASSPADGASPAAAAPTEPAASPTDAAATSVNTDELLRTGIAAYKSRDYEAARNAFLAAFQQDPATSVAAMLADVEMKLKRYRDAAEHWAIYVNGLGPEREGDRSEALAQLDECFKYVGLAEVTVEPKSGVVIADGRVVNLELTAGDLWFEPGEHTLELKVGEQVVASRKVLIGPSNRVQVSLEAPPPEPKPVLVQSTAVPLAETKAHSKSLEPRTWVLIGGGLLTLAGATVGGIYWYKNREDKKEANALLAKVNSQTTDSALIESDSVCAQVNPPTACSALKAKNDEMNRSAKIADYSLLAAGIVGVATIGTYLLWPSKKTESKPATTGLVVSPWWSPESQGVSASLRF